MRNDCWLKSNNIQDELELFFRDVDKELSSYYEENPDMREEHLESRLATLLEHKPFAPHARRLTREHTRLAQKPINLSVAVRHITHSERQHGADIGLIADIDCPGEYKLTKAVLVQGKRLYPANKSFDQNCAYQEIFKTGTSEDYRPQWSRLLGLTPAAVYFLYNPERLLIKRTIRDLGTRVVNARIIEGVHAAGQNVFTATDSFEQGRSFANWMVDEFICCDVGDTRKDVISIALGGSPDFPIRRSITVRLTREQVDQASLFGTQ
jgi:hypothetical protein